MLGETETAAAIERGIDPYEILNEDADRAQRGFHAHSMAVFDLNTDPREYVNLIDTDVGQEVLAWAIQRHDEIGPKGEGW